MLLPVCCLRLTGLLRPSSPAGVKSVYRSCFVGFKCSCKVLFCRRYCALGGFTWPSEVMAPLIISLEEGTWASFSVACNDVIHRPRGESEAHAHSTGIMLPRHKWATD